MTGSRRTAPRDDPAPAGVRPAGLLGPHDLHLFAEGTHRDLASKLGAHPAAAGDARGTAFAVWAPRAERVSVIGAFNDWDPDRHPLHPVASSGIWEGLVPGVGHGELYKYRLVTAGGAQLDRADPFAAFCEIPPRSASIVWDPSYAWEDGEWMRTRGGRNGLDDPMSVYEVHIGSWMRVAGEGNRSLSYRELAGRLGDHVERMGFTHVELLPVMEHPFFGSWGYQVTGFFAPSSRFGTPQDLMYLIDHLHQRGIGVILDWVPSHFPNDEYALARFDGGPLYEHPDPRMAVHPDWNSLQFDYARGEVRSFLLSSAFHWLSAYHADGLRLDAVASMLYLDYSRKPGEWTPNVRGGRENLDAVDFLRELNEAVYEVHPDVQMVAEESTSWPLVSRPTHLGGLGFGLKWDMGWMHDTLEYLGHDPVHRKYHHTNLTFRQLYAFAENFVLPLSHDEVVHGKGSLLNKMAGDRWQKLANLRLLYGYLFGVQGKKLLFMGGEFAQPSEWNHDGTLDWHVLDDPAHAGVARWVQDLNALYRAEPALHEKDAGAEGFEWIDANDSEGSVTSFLRWGGSGDVMLVVCNFTPVARAGHRVGVPRGGFWREVLNGDATLYGGTGWGNLGGVEATPVPFHGRHQSLSLALPPLAALFLKPEPSAG